MGKLKVALVQVCSGPVIKDNLYCIEQLLQKHREHPVDLMILPESFAYFGHSNPGIARQSNLLRNWMSELAKNYRCSVIGGTIPYSPAEGSKNLASCFVYGAMGEELGRYDKIHLFDATINDNKGCYRESEEFQPGSKPLTISLDKYSACVGLSVCYDLRFPELYRCLTDAGANILCAPSAFTCTTGEAHWEVLLRARAIENQCYVLAANQGGNHPDGRQTWGHSMVVSPWGEIIAHSGLEETVVFAEIDLEQLKNIREKLPCLLNKKLGSLWVSRR